MRDRARQRALAGAKSRRATSEELRDAAKRVKEIEGELLQIDLQPETKWGESRLERYQRVLRLRSMRQRFQAGRPLDTSDQPNGALLALAMTVMTVLLCAFCAGGALVGIQFLHQKPDPIAAAAAFWDNMETQAYAEVEASYLSPTLRVQFENSANNLFESAAKQADANYGQITNYQLLSQAGDLTQTAQLTYLITRGSHTTYKTTLTLILHGGVWGIDDLGSAINPQAAGLPPPPPSVTPSATSFSGARRPNSAA
jgi:hypothetical protein